MKNQHKFWFRTIDSFLPKHRQHWPVIELYRSRALVQTCFIGALINPLALLLNNERFSVIEKLGLSALFFMISAVILWIYRRTGRLQACCTAYLCYTAIALIWAQYSARTLYAPYWNWFPLLIVYCTLMLGLKSGAIFTILLGIACSIVFWLETSNPHRLGTFADASSLFFAIVVQVVLIQLGFWMFMFAYDSIRNRTEVRAGILSYTNDETDRLATVGERMGTMALQLNEQLDLFQGQLSRMDVLARRSDTKVEELQKLTLELQERARQLSQISKILQKDKIEVLEMLPVKPVSPDKQSA